MRKILFAILAIIMLIAVGLVIYKGFSIGKFEVWGIKRIIAENEEIDKANAYLEKLASDDFNSALKSLNTSGETMQKEKKEYEEQAVLVSNSKYYMQTEKYKIDFLWTRIGNYAKDNNVTPKMEVAKGTATGIYNLIITAVGKYQNVANFIYAIENDSRLGFKIEDFSMTQHSGEGSNLVQGKFTCKEIKIDIKSIDSESSNSNDKTADGESQPSQNESSNTNSTNTINSNTTNTTTTNTINTENSTGAAEQYTNAESTENTANT